MVSNFLTAADEVTCVETPTAAEAVDDRGYLAANPDVVTSGLSPRAHFKSVGQAQGRLQAINIDQVIGLRNRKLAKMAFLAEPPEGRQPGRPLNFLSPELLDEFGIPDSPPVSAHPYPETVIQLIRDNPDKLFLDVGAGLRPTYYANVVNTEIYPSFSTDVLCVGEAMPFASGLFDFVFCFATLEHTRRPWDVAAEICRVLKPGGTVMIDYPFMQPVHGYPHHYFNATPMGNRSLFEHDCDIQSVEIGWHHHPMIGLQWMLTVFHRGLQAVDAKAFGNLRVVDIVDQSLDTLLKEPYSVNLHADMRRVIASGSLLIATKKDQPAHASQSNIHRQITDEPVIGAARRRPASEDTRIAELMRQNSALRTQRDALLNSTSWRLTSPLRACAGILRRPK
jgi:SAM-dependent methyltransferase